MASNPFDFKKLRKQLDDANSVVLPHEGRPRSERRAERREALLPADRTCPRCGKVKLKSRQWVCKEGLVMCLTCWRTS